MGKAREATKQETGRQVFGCGSGSGVGQKVGVKAQEKARRTLDWHSQQARGTSGYGRRHGQGGWHAVLGRSICHFGEERERRDLWVGEGRLRGAT